MTAAVVRAAARAAAFSLAAAGCGAGAQPGGADGAGVPAPTAPTPTTAAPDGPPPAPSTSVPPVGDPAMFYTFTGRHSGWGAGDLPAMVGCLMGPGDRYAYETEIRLAVDQDSDGGRADRMEAAISAVSVMSVDAADGSGTVVSYLTKITGVETEGADGQGGGWPASVYEFRQMADTCPAGEASGELAGGPGMADALEVAWAGFLADHLTIPPPIRFQTTSSAKPIKPEGATWSTRRSPAPPSVGAHTAERRRPSLELGFATTGVETLQSQPGGDTLKVEYTTVTPGKLDLNLATGERGAGIDQDSEWQILFELQNARVEGTAEFLLVEDPGGGVYTLPYRIDETYTATMHVTRDTPSWGGLLSNAPAESTQVDLEWEANISISLVGSDYDPA